MMMILPFPAAVIEWWIVMDDDDDDDDDDGHAMHECLGPIVNKEHRQQR